MNRFTAFFYGGKTILSEALSPCPFPPLFFCFFGVIARRFNKFAEERTRSVRTAFEFRVKLYAEHPRVIGRFAYFNQIAFGVYARNDETRLYQSVAVGIVEFVAVTVTFPNPFGAVCFFGKRTGPYFAFVFSETERTSENLSVFVGNQIDDWIARLFIHLRRVRIF